MAFLVRFPKVAPGIEQAMVGAWRKSIGDRVAKGEGLVEIVTDKATFDLEAEADGTLLRVLAPEKSAIPINYIVAVLGDPGEEPPDVAEENARLMAAHRQRAREAAWRGPQPPQEPSAGRVRATPSARRLAKTLGLDLAEVAASARGGVVKDEDVRGFAEQRTQAREARREQS